MKSDNEVIAEWMDFKHEETNISHPAVGKYYHTSWDWLMPVVHKILITWIPADGEWPYEYKTLERMVIGCQIKQVYACVVEFIKWYNTQQK